MMEATGWRWLPSQLLAEPDWLMDDLFTLRYEYQAVREAMKK